MVDAVRRLSTRWAAEGRPSFDIGVGISSGRVMAGTIGSDRRRELVVVGRPMVMAARMQRMTRSFDAHIIVGEETLRQVDNVVQHRALGRPGSRASGSARRCTRSSASGTPAVTRAASA